MGTKKAKAQGDTEFESAIRALYLITASMNYALNELLKAKNKVDQLKSMKRLDEDVKHLRSNVEMMRTIVNRKEKGQ